MQICFLGHQSWLVEGRHARVLIDPLLLDSFGASDQFGLQVYPPRNIDVSALPRADAIILTHEHSDHFHLPSLNCLPRSAVVYMGALVVEPVARALRAMGFEVRRVRSPEPIAIGDLRVRLYAAHSETALWESRVNQIHVEQEGHDRGLFICVDALLSEGFAQAVATGLMAPPSVVVVSNNSQITPPGVIGALQNLAADPWTDKSKQGLLGLQVLRSLVASVEALPPPECLVICGGGFMKNYDNFGPFPFSEQDTLGRLATRLTPDQPVIGLLPGQMLLADARGLRIDEVDWIRLDSERHARLEAQRERFLREGRSVPERALTGTFADEEDERRVREVIEAELVRLAPHLMMSPLGQHLLRASSAARAPGGDAPFALVLTDGLDGAARVFRLNLVTGAFESDPDGAEGVLDRVRTGLRIGLRDYYAVITGEIQVWDLAGVAMHGWFDGPIFEGPVAFMYSFYGENTSPDLLQVVLESQLRTLDAVPCI